MPNKHRFNFTFLLRDNLDLSRSDVWVKFFVYPFSMPLSWLVLNFTGIGANPITILGLVSSLSGALLSPWFGIPAVATGFFTAYVLDFVDGQVAGAKGGSSLGVKLDMIVDRTSILAAAVALSYIHLCRNEAAEIFFIVNLLVSYFLLDSLQLAGMLAKAKYGGIQPAPRREVRNTFRGIFLNPLTWLPQRLSSPIFIALVWWVTGEARWGYASGILSAGCEFFVSRVRKKCSA